MIDARKNMFWCRKMLLHDLIESYLIWFYVIGAVVAFIISAVVVVIILVIIFIPIIITIIIVPIVTPVNLIFLFCFFIHYFYYYFLDGEYCPSESGWAVGDCLKKVESDKISKECSSFITLQETCRADIEKHCSGKEYSGDLLVCLAEWVKNILWFLCLRIFFDFFTLL